MTDAFELERVTKRFKKTIALDDVTLAAPTRTIIGLLGRNGSGKTTLLRHLTGMYLPTSGRCMTLGVPSAELTGAEFSRIGVVHQHDPLLAWMKASQLLRYVGSFYERWDRDLEERLLRDLEVDRDAKVGTMSPGNVQRLALVLATCHHPSLLLLDEPLSDLDPVARQSVLAMLLDRFRSDEVTIVISSHLLQDVERIVDRIVCLDRGRVVADAELDALKETYAEWVVTSGDGRLPVRFDEPYVLRAEGDGHRVRLIVRNADAQLRVFASVYGAEVERRPMNLERIFLLLTHGDQQRHAPALETVP